MGLTLALRLAQNRHKVTLFEAASEIGGLAAAWTLDGVTWDKHYHVTLLSDTWTRAILRELDLDSQVRWVETKTAFFADGRLSPLSNALDYLRLPVMGTISKLRLAATIIHASRVRGWQRLEQMPVRDWLRRWSGSRAFDRLWQPLLKAKLGEEYQRASAAFIWATIQRLYAARRTGLKKEMLGYVPGGYSTTLQRFAGRLSALGVDLRLGTPVDRIERAGIRLRVVTPDADENFDRVVVTTTPALASRMCVDLTQHERQCLASIDYQGIVCAAVLLERPLGDCYLTYLAEEGLPITAVVDMTALAEPDQFDGCGLVYLPRYSHHSEPIFEESDKAIESRFLGALARVYPSFQRDQVRCCRISRVREVFPIPTLGYSTRVPSPSTSIPGLHIINSAHIINGTLNVNDTVRVAEREARVLIETDGLATAPATGAAG